MLWIKNMLEYIYRINICLLYGYIYDTTEEKESG